MKQTDVYYHKVQYYETDRMAVVHHSNYVRWLEEARLDYMKANGVDYHEIENQHILMPVVNVSCEYKKSAQFGDTAAIYTDLCVYNSIIMEFNYRIVDSVDGSLLCTGHSKHCFIDEQTRKPINLKKRLPEYHKVIMDFMESKAE